MDERRKSVRDRTFLGGVIAFNNRSSTMDCMVRNLTAEGAKVTFTNTAVIPDRFDLVIDRKQRSFNARMVWRGADEAGVVFVDEYANEAPIPLEWVKRLRNCEAEKAALQQRVEDLTIG